MAPLLCYGITRRITSRLDSSSTTHASHAAAIWCRRRSKNLLPYASVEQISLRRTRLRLLRLMGDIQGQSKHVWAPMRSDRSWHLCDRGLLLKDVLYLWPSTSPAHRAAGSTLSHSARLIQDASWKLYCVPPFGIGNDAAQLLCLALRVCCILCKSARTLSFIRHPYVCSVVISTWATWSAGWSLWGWSICKRRIDVSNSALTWWEHLHWVSHTALDGTLGCRTSDAHRRHTSNW